MQTKETVHACEGAENAGYMLSAVHI